MKKFMRVLCLVLVLVLVLAPVTSLATEATIFTDSAVSEEDTFNLKPTIDKVGGGIYSILRAIAIIVAVCMVAYMAIQWFLATPSKKAELKGRMWSMAIGVLLLVGGVWILGIVESAVNAVKG